MPSAPFIVCQECRHLIGCVMKRTCRRKKGAATFYKCLETVFTVEILNALNAKQDAEGECGADALLTGDEVMAEIEGVASVPVLKVLRDAYEGNGRWPADKGKIADVVLRDLALEPVTMYRRKVPKNEAPIYQRRAPTQEGVEDGGASDLGCDDAEFGMSDHRRAEGKGDGK